MLAYTVNVLAVFNVEFLLLFYKVKNGRRELQTISIYLHDLLCFWYKTIFIRSSNMHYT